MEVTVISEGAFSFLKERVTLQKPTRVLYGPASQLLEVLGQFRATISSDQTSSSETIYVVQGLRNNLLGLPAIDTLHLAHRVGACVAQPDLQKEFPNLF